MTPGFPKPEVGLVLSYSYLWRYEQALHQEEGRKDRPCVIVLALQNKKGQIDVAVVPVTHTPPHDPDMAVEIPPSVKSHLKLDEVRSWIICSEVNLFTWPGPNLRFISGLADRIVYGFIPPRLFQTIKSKIAERWAKRQLDIVKRTS